MAEMDNIDQQHAKLERLKMEKEKWQNHLKKIEEEAMRLKEKKEMLELEVQERTEHHRNLMELYDMETKNQKDKKVTDPEDELENAEEARKGLKDVEKRVFEKLTFHMDKYYTYIEENIKLTIKKNEDQEDAEGYAPPQVQAVMVKCLKSAFPENQAAAMDEDDEEGASVITVRLSKKNTFYDLKKTCVYYWNLLSSAEKKVQEEQDNENYQGKEEKKEEKTIQSSHTSMTAIPLKQFELIFENSVVHDNEELDRFISNQLLQTESQYFMLTLKRKKPKKPKAHNISNKDTKNGEHSQADGELKSMTMQQDKLESEKSKDNAVSQKELDMIEEEENEEEEMGKQNQERFMHSKLYKIYQGFFSKLPYIRKYFVITDQDVLKIEQQQKDQDDIKKQKGFTFDDNNVCMVFLLFLLLLINILYMNILDNQSVFISHIKQLNKLLYVSPVNANTTPKKVYWNDISTFQELETYLMDYQGMPGQLFDKDSQLRKNYEIIGAFRFRQIRTKQISCPYPRRTERPSQVKCKSELFTKDTQFTSQIQAGQFQWQNFMPVEKVNINRDTIGKFNQYDSSGYILDIKKENQTVRAYQNLVVEQMIQNSYFTIETLAQFITFTLRSTNDGSFFFIEFLLEYTSSGIFPQQPTIIPFSPNIYGTDTNSPTSVLGLTTPSPPTPPSDFNVGLRLYVLDIFKILIGIVFIVYVIVVIISTMGNQDKSLGLDLTYFISLTFILNFLVIFTTFFSVSIAISHSNFDLEVTELQQEVQFIDLGNNASVYNEILRSTSANVTVLMIRTVFLLSFFNSFEALINTIQSSYLQIFASFVMLIFVTIGFAFVGQSIWGYYIQSFSTFGEAVLSLLLITIGCFDLQKLLSTDLSISLTYLGSYYFFIYQFMFGIIAVIYIDSYRLTIIHMGIAKEKKWTIYHWFLWLFSWLPEKHKKKCYKAIENKAIENN